MNFTDVQGTWKQIKAYIDTKISSNIGIPINSLQDGVYFYSNNLKLCFPQCYDISDIKSSITGILIYCNGYKFLFGGSYRSKNKVESYLNAGRVSVYLYDYLIPKGVNYVETVDNIGCKNISESIYKAATILKDTNYTYINLCGEVVVTAIDSTTSKFSMFDKSNIIICTTAQNWLIEQYKSDIIEMYKRAFDEDLTIYQTRSARSGTSHLLITSDFLSYNNPNSINNKSLYEYYSRTLSDSTVSSSDKYTSLKYSVKPLLEYKAYESSFQENSYAYCNTAVLL